MPNTGSCPISGVTVDSVACRLAATITLGILVTALATGAHWLAGLVAIEFAMRLRFGLGSSPLGLLARTVARALRLRQRIVDAAPKRFAAGIALSLSVAAFVAQALPGGHSASAVLIAMFAACAALEGILGLCLGCKIYAVLPSSVLALHRRKEVA